MTETVGDWAAWIVAGVSLAFAALILCSVIVGAIRERRERRTAVPQPQD
jgi:hypothetical protein